MGEKVPTKPVDPAVTGLVVGAGVVGAVELTRGSRLRAVRGVGASGCGDVGGSETSDVADRGRRSVDDEPADDGDDVAAVEDSRTAVGVEAADGRAGCGSDDRTSAGVGPGAGVAVHAPVQTSVAETSAATATVVGQPTRHAGIDPPSHARGEVCGHTFRMSSVQPRVRPPRLVRSSASLAARERAREEVRAQLRAVARRHIAERGAADLSLRAVARELGMTSSAVYRYVNSRDDLLTSMIVESYESVAAVAEHADRERAGAGSNPAERWLAVARAIRDWAHEHPHEYALIYGSPIPGYRAPAEAGPASSRVWRVVAGVMESAVSTGSLRPPARPFDVDGLIAGHVLAAVSLPAAPFTDYIVRGMALFSSLIGGISAELFGHFHGLTTDADRVFDLVVATGAQGVGLELPVSQRDREPEPRGARSENAKEAPALWGSAGAPLRGAGSAGERIDAPSPRTPG